MAGQFVRDVMTTQLTTLPTTATISEAAKRMRDDNIGDVLVLEDGLLRGVLTDRDIVVRCVADGSDPSTVSVGDVCSAEPTVVSADAPADDAVRQLREAAVRRLPVVDQSGNPVGVVSIGDLAVENDPHSALADISAAPPNR